MLDKSHIKLRIDSELYQVVFDPFKYDRPEWFIKKYIIRDMYYTDSCYVILEDYETQETKTLQMVDELVTKYFYSEESAQYYIDCEKKRDCCYAWGYSSNDT